MNKSRLETLVALHGGDIDEVARLILHPGQYKTYCQWADEFIGAPTDREQRAVDDFNLKVLHLIQSPIPYTLKIKRFNRIHLVFKDTMRRIYDELEKERKEAEE